MIRHGKLDLAALFDPDMLGDDLEAWLAESALMKRTFRNCAVISGLIARRFTGEEKIAPPGAVLDRPRSTTCCASISPITCCCAPRAPTPPPVCSISSDWVICSRVFRGESTHRELDHVSPLAVPVMLEIGRESVYGEAADELLAEAADELVKEAMG